MLTDLWENVCHELKTADAAGGAGSTRARSQAGLARQSPRVPPRFLTKSLNQMLYIQHMAYTNFPRHNATILTQPTVLLTLQPSTLCLSRSSQETINIKMRAYPQRNRLATPDCWVTGWLGCWARGCLSCWVIGAICAPGACATNC